MGFSTLGRGRRSHYFQAHTVGVDIFATPACNVNGFARNDLVTKFIVYSCGQKMENRHGSRRIIRDRDVKKATPAESGELADQVVKRRMGDALHLAPPKLP